MHRQRQARQFSIRRGARSSYAIEVQLVVFLKKVHPMLASRAEARARDKPKHHHRYRTRLAPAVTHVYTMEKSHVKPVSALHHAMSKRERKNNIP